MRKPQRYEFGEFVLDLDAARTAARIETVTRRGYLGVKNFAYCRRKPAAQTDRLL
jgi:hypothetical protein